TLRDWHALMEAAHTLWDANGQLTSKAAAALSARDSEEREAAAFMLWNARANAPAIENLLHDLRRADGRQAERRFLPQDRSRYPSQFTTPVLPGVITHVLGPPRDAAFRKQRKVPSTWGFEEALSTALSEEIGSPFPDEWRVGEDRLP